MENYQNIISLAIAFLALFGLAELIFHFGKTKAEYTRKLVHIGTGLLTMLFPILLGSIGEVLFLCASFAVILGTSLRFGLLPSINAVGRKTHGSLCYPLAVVISFFAMERFGGEGQARLLWFYLPILIMALADPAAALVGRRWPIKTFRVGSGNKSLMGCLVFFIVAGLVAISVYSTLGLGFPPLILLFSIALSSMVVEAAMPLGLDNLAIPLVVIFCLLIQ